MKKHHTIIPAIAMSLIALAGCSSSSETTSAPSPTATTPLDLGTYIPSTRDATPSASASSGSSSGGGTATSSKSQTATPATGSTAVPTLASGKTVEFTDEELAKYQAGEYVVATEKHPAYNVPVPVMPAEANSSSAENAEKFVTYWGEELNYALQTGDNARFIAVTDSVDMSTFTEIAESVKQLRNEGGWLEGLTYTVDVISSEQSILKNSYLVKINYGYSSGTNFNFNGTVEETIQGDPPGIIVVRANWQDDGWVLSSVESVEGRTQ